MTGEAARRTMVGTSASCDRQSCSAHRGVALEAAAHCSCPRDFMREGQMSGRVGTRLLEALCGATPGTIPSLQVAVVVAHPDDEVIDAGALLSRLRDAIVVCVSAWLRDPRGVRAGTAEGARGGARARRCGRETGVRGRNGGPGGVVLPRQLVLHSAWSLARSRRTLTAGRPRSTCRMRITPSSGACATAT